MIDSILIDEENFQGYSMFSEGSEMSSFSKINIFIGENNSGKSRFCRAFFSNEEIKFNLREINLERINELIRDLRNELKKYLEYHFHSNVGTLLSEFFSKFIEQSHLSNNFSPNTFIFNRLESLKSFSLNGRATDSGESILYFEETIRGLSDKYFKKFESEFGDRNRIISEKGLYIPTLRGLRKISKEDDPYKERTIKDYFKKSVNRVSDKIYTGLSLYELTKELLLGAKNDRDKVKDFESFLSNTFFYGKEFNIIPRIGEDVLHVRIGKEEFPIYDLGDGIQSIIILTYPLFFNIGQKLNVFIEEPEQHLHPGLQRIFLETLLNPKFESFQYFITTHSNHFLDITLDVNQVSVYTFKKTNTSLEHPTFVIENVENENLNTLELIGVRNSSVFLSNCTIWVEGITDRIYLRRYLDVFQKGKDLKFTEDIHYSFVEYGGNNITHWSFLDNTDSRHPNIDVDRLCGKLFLITDRDSAGLNLDGSPNLKASKKQQRHEELKETLKERYYCLEAREIENTLGLYTIKHTIENFEGASAIELEYSPKFMDDESYKNNYLGAFIEDNVKNLTRSYRENSGTLKDKVNFAKKAVENIASKNMLSVEATILAEKLYQFIKNNNG